MDLIGLVGWRVLAGDLLDYVRFRAVCTDWRSSTVCPLGRGIVDPRFHPRRWMILPDPRAMASILQTAGNASSISPPDPSFASGSRSYLTTASLCRSRASFSCGRCTVKTPP